MMGSETKHITWQSEGFPPIHSDYYLIDGAQSSLVNMPDGNGVKCQPTHDTYGIVTNNDFRTMPIYDAILYTREEDFFPFSSNYFIPNGQYAIYASHQKPINQIYSVTSPNRDRIAFRHEGYPRNSLSVYERDELNNLDNVATLEATQEIARHLADAGIYCVNDEGKSVPYAPSTRDLGALLSGQFPQEQVALR